MSQNYNLNSNFGLNVSNRGAKPQNIKEASKNIAQKAGSLFDSFGNYVDKYENVFSGEVEKEINMYSRQAMFVGMNLKAGEKTNRFDMNI